jgi:putative salt-induced outer membrane protein YdiY
LLLAVAPFTRADSVVTTDGERFIGKVIKQMPDKVVIESVLGGRLTIPRDQVQELHLDSAPTSRPATRLASTQPWRPPGVGTDGFDWLELKSGEWLKGRLRFVEKNRLEFESEELETQKFKLKDVQRLYPAKPVNTKFEDMPSVLAPMKLENGLVTVESAEPVELPTDRLTGITPGSRRERDYWSGELGLGIGLQSGNTREFDLAANASLERRTPVTRLDLDYLANFSIVNEVETADNQRFDGAFDILFDKGFFVRPVDLDYFRDTLANIDNRVTIGVGVGYYLFDRDDLEWTVSVGPSYQTTWFLNVPPGEEDIVSAPAARLGTKFKMELTSRLDLLMQYTIDFTSEESGSNSQHAEVTLRYEFTHSFDADLSYIWDRTQHTQEEANGTIPNRDDERLTLSVGWRF